MSRLTSTKTRLKYYSGEFRQNPPFSMPRVKTSVVVWLFVEMTIDRIPYVHRKFSLSVANLHRMFLTGQSWPLFPYFRLFHYIMQLTDEQINCQRMLGFEPRISGVRSDRSANCTTTTAQPKEAWFQPMQPSKPNLSILSRAEFTQSLCPGSSFQT